MRGRKSMNDHRLLAGRCILVTRPAGRAASLVARLEALGAEVVHAPAIRIEPPESWAPLDEALARIDGYDWMVFTSVNGVEAFYERAGTMPRLRYAAIGPATAEAIAERGGSAEVIPERSIAEALFEALSEHTDVKGQKFLLPLAAIAREKLPNSLRGAGATVDVVAIYRTLPATKEIAHAVKLVRKGSVDAVTFTSASTVRAFFDGADEAMRAQTVSASIGPITSAALRAERIEPAIEAEHYTSAGLVDAIRGHFSKLEPRAWPVKPESA